MMHKFAALSAISAALVLAGCSSTPLPLDAKPQELPAAWAQGTPAPTNPDWWNNLGDPRLGPLVEEALRANTDIRGALQRVAQARAQVGITDADRGLQLGVEASATRARAARSQVAPGVSPYGTSLGVGLQVAYEVDLWGRYAQATRAARSDLAATEADQAAVRLTVAAETARLYFALVALEAQAAISRQAITQQREALGLQERRANAGVISDFELKQIRAEIATLEADLPNIVQQRDRAQTALAVLLGRSPKDIFLRVVEPGTPPVPGAMLVPAGLPSELLLRRPDLVRAQYQLAAADARVDVARTAGYPSLALTGTAGSLAPRASDLFSGSSFVWSIGAAVAQTILDGGRRQATTEYARATRELALVQWEASVARAFGEVRDAINGQANSAAAAKAQRDRMTALREVRELARLRFDNGIASQIDLLDADRQLLAAQSALVAAEQAQRNAVVDLYRALGGGWQAQQP
ncbi:MAG: TolC family protein [Burkholderiaceae bacterium]